MAPMRTEPPKLPALRGDADPSNRVIRVDRAIRCCQAAADQLLGMLNQLSTAIVENVEGETLAFVPAPSPVVTPGTTSAPSVVRIPFGQAIPIGAIVAIAAPLFQDLDQRIGKNQLAEMVQGLADAVRKLNRTETKTKASPCESCMMRNALPQTPNRRRTKKSVRSRR